LSQKSGSGKITMPIAGTFWGAYFGMLVDKFGIIWMVNYDMPKN
jgi:PhnB protein